MCHDARTRTAGTRTRDAGTRTRRGRPGTGRLPLLVLAPLLASLGCGAGEAGRAQEPGAAEEPQPRRMVVLGFDGMDHGLTERLLSEGKLPNLARLAESGGFFPLGTAIPPQSPVAWSDFITGLDAGGHGIFDFIHRKPDLMTPYLSTSEMEEPSRTLALGGWRIPLSGGGPRLLRRGTPFWKVLEERGIPTTIVRMPANFPPSGEATRELTGMGTPDILGGYGTFSLYTTRLEHLGEDPSGGNIYLVRRENGVIRDSLRGPPNPLREDGRRLTLDFTLHVDPVRPVAQLSVEDEAILLNEGEWSDWTRVSFRMLPLLASLNGIARFYLKEVHPQVELYVTPINLDPLAPAMPISTPEDFAAELARATGLYYTQGMPEDTKALSAGVLDQHEFLRQARLAAEEHVEQYEYLLDGFTEGALFAYFGFVDQVSHMMWHARDPEHPAHDPVRDAPFATAVESLYVRADEIVGLTLDRFGDDALLVVMSDHGFASWRRAFHLNAWLRDNGYLTVREDEEAGDEPFLQGIDWSRTRAYGLGLSGLYLNLRGRERFGTVEADRYRSLRDEIAGKLLEVVDPATGRRAITKVYVRDETYADAGHLEEGPDLIVGYARGVRASDATAEGRVPEAVFEDNTGMWSGDHIMDHEEVPGVVFSSRPLRRRPSALRELAGALLAEFGIETFPPETPADGVARGR